MAPNDRCNGRRNYDRDYQTNCSSTSASHGEFQHPLKTIRVPGRKPATLARGARLEFGGGGITVPIINVSATAKPRAEELRELQHLPISMEPFEVSMLLADELQVPHLTESCFYKFLDLPRELRLRIFGFVLASTNPINPQLCNHSLKFHDTIQEPHNAVWEMLAITRVSQQIRQEALPVFYAVNTFLLDADLTTYFSRLEHLGRFRMIRRVQFDVFFERPESVAVTLRSMNQYIKETDEYEASLLKEYKQKHPQDHTVSASSLVGATYSNLTKHPQYRRGGLSEMNTLIALRRLTSLLPSTSTSPILTHRLVLLIPSIQSFTTFPLLQWLPSTLQGLGIHIHFVQGIAVQDISSRRVILTWLQKYQKKDFNGEDEASDVACQSLSAEQVKKNALEKFPDLESMKRPRVRMFMRPACDGQSVRWFSVHTEGGGIF